MNYALITEITGIGSADWNKLESLYDKSCDYGDFDSLEGVTGGELFYILVDNINRGAISMMKDEFEAGMFLSKRIKEFMEDDIYDFIDELSDCNYMCSHEGLIDIDGYNGYNSDWRKVLAGVIWEARRYGKF